MFIFTISHFKCLIEENNYSALCYPFSQPLSYNIIELQREGKHYVAIVQSLVVMLIQCWHSLTISHDIVRTKLASHAMMILLCFPLPEQCW